jgi:hypothetical protein
MARQQGRKSLREQSKIYPTQPDNKSWLLKIVCATMNEGWAKIWVREGRVGSE